MEHPLAIGTCRKLLGIKTDARHGIDACGSGTGQGRMAGRQQTADGRHGESFAFGAVCPAAPAWMLLLIGRFHLSAAFFMT